MRAPNQGWKCSECGHDEYGTGSAERVLDHIRNEHPELIQLETWAMTPIRGDEYVFDRSTGQVVN